MTHSDETKIPLVVDLDGTLITADLLWEATVLLLGRKPLLLFLLPVWLLRGKAEFKSQVADRIAIDAETLPFNTEFLKYLRQERINGRPLVLATASDYRYAKSIADRLNLFESVIGTSLGNNCSGPSKLEKLRETHTGLFDYAGNSFADLPLWSAARRSIIVNAPPKVLARARKIRDPYSVFPRSPPTPADFLRLLRPVQWAKNLLLFVPLLMAHDTVLENWLVVLLTFCTLSVCASATYVLNDLTDIASDRRHPRKRQRPLASGKVSVPAALLLAGTLLFSGLLLASLAGPPILPILICGYIIATVLYSYVLKEKVFVDVLVLAGLYTYRILIGGTVVGITPSHWLLVFSVFIFLSLALAKRFTELNTSAAQGTVNKRRGYRPEDLELLGHLGPTCGYLAVLVFLLYIAGDTATLLYKQPQFLWLAAPMLLYWVTRIWFLAHRGELTDDPLVFAVKDRHTYIVGLLVATLFILAI